MAPAFSGCFHGCCWINKLSPPADPPALSFLPTATVARSAGSTSQGGAVWPPGQPADVQAGRLVFNTAVYGAVFNTAAGKAVLSQFLDTLRANPATVFPTPAFGRMKLEGGSGLRLVNDPAYPCSCGSECKAAAAPQTCRLAAGNPTSDELQVFLPMPCLRLLDPARSRTAPQLCYWDRLHAFPLAAPLPSPPPPVMPTRPKSPPPPPRRSPPPPRPSPRPPPPRPMPPSPGPSPPPPRLSPPPPRPQPRLPPPSPPAQPLEPAPKLTVAQAYGPTSAMATATGATNVTWAKWRFTATPDAGAAAQHAAVESAAPENWWYGLEADMTCERQRDGWLVLSLKRFCGSTQ